MPSVSDLLLYLSLGGIIWMVFKNLVIAVYSTTITAYKTLGEIKGTLSDLQTSTSNLSDEIHKALDDTDELRALLEEEEKLIASLTARVTNLEVEILEIFHKLRMKRRIR